MNNLPLFDQPEGATFAAELDGQRLGRQAAAVWRAMTAYLRFPRAKEWWTDEELARSLSSSIGGVGARRRDFRKSGHTVEGRRRGDPKRGLWEYRLIPKETK